MAREKCNVCGGSFHSAFYRCPHCGIKRSDEDLLKSVDLAYNADDPNAARRFYNDILARDRGNAQAYWGLFLLDHGVKDGIFNEGIANIRVPAENYLTMNLTERLYDSIILNDNYLCALRLAEGELKTRCETFRKGLEEKRVELASAYSDSTSFDGVGKANGINRSTQALTDEKITVFGAFTRSNKKSVGSAFDDEAAGLKTRDGSARSEPDPEDPNMQSEKTTVAPRKAPKFSARNCVTAIVCCIPTVLESIIVLSIPYIGFLAKNPYLAEWGWKALSVPMKISFLSLIVAGFSIQALGLFGKLNKPLGMATQIVSFMLFMLAVDAANNNIGSVYTQWGLAVIAPVSLLVAVWRYMTADKFGFTDDFDFRHYIPLALEVFEYIVFFLVFPLMFDASASLWIFVTLTVTTISAIAVSSLREDFRWIAVGVNLGVVVLLCLLFWLGRLFASEWLWNGGIIIVVILAIGGSWFIHWFIHRKDA